MWRMMKGIGVFKMHGLFLINKCNIPKISHYKLRLYITLENTNYKVYDRFHGKISTKKQPIRTVGTCHMLKARLGL